MKLFKKCALILVAILSVLSAASCGSKHIFRNVDFGMSQEQVKEAEKDSEFSKTTSSGFVYIIDSVYGVEAEELRVSYSFSADKLNKIMLYVTTNSASETQTAFDAIKQEMIDQFGKDYEDNSYELIWETNDTEVTLMYMFDTMAILTMKQK